MIEDLSVRHRHDVHRAKLGRLRILTGTDFRFAAAVIGVTDLAFLSEQILPCCDGCGIVTKRIGSFLCLCWHTCMQQPRRDRCLKGGGLAASA
jgi:hypothetical protein